MNAVTDATSTVNTASAIDPLETQALFEKMLEKGSGPVYEPTSADLIEDPPAKDEQRKPMTKVEIDNLKTDLLAMLEEHEENDGRFCHDDHGVARIVEDGAEIYVRKHKAPQDLIGVMALGYEPLIDVHATVREAFGILASEVEALEVGWLAHSLRSKRAVALLLADVDASVASMALELACEVMGPPAFAQETQDSEVTAE